nr:proline dehydrogenase family protein [Sunxiuqinia sp.]
MFNKMIANMLPYMPKKLIWLFSKRYIAGEGMEEGLEASRKLNEQNIEVTIDLLGEFITSLEQAEENKKQYLEIIERFTSENIRGNFSLKPTMFGLLIDQEVCYQHLREIVAKAAEKNNFIRIDMEDSQCVGVELELFKKLKKEFSGHVGLVIQAYLKRTLNDLVNFSNFPSNGHPLNFRLCKGIYVEPKQIAYKDYQEVRNHFLEDLEFMFKNKMYAGIATHDKYLVEEAMKLIDKYQVPKSMYEFQMLYGVTPELRNSIVEAGHKMRVYVPFGKQWFNYSTRRLKENPEIASHIIKALFIKG